MSIQNDIEEIKRIELEMKRLNKIIIQLRKQKHEAKQRIDSFLEHKNQIGAKYGNLAIMRTEKEKRQTIGRTKRIKEDEGITVLKRFGLDENDAKEVFKELTETLRGPKISVNDIIIQKINKQA